MTRAARIVFALLVLATLGAFVVTQKLKSGPPLVVRPYISTVFSPAHDARVRQARVSFWIVHGDDISVSIVDADGQIVRRLIDGRHLAAHKRITRFWNGRTDAGRVAPDGSYRVRVALLGQGRTIDLAQPIVLDTRPPRPLVTNVEPRAAGGPAFLPQRGVRAVTIHVRGTEGRQARVLIWRTDLTPPRQVGQLTIPAGRASTTWDGTLGGSPAPAGTYLMGLLVADRSGNPGTFPARLPPSGRISTPPTHAGVTIRYLAAAPPLTPVVAGAVATVYVDARDHPYQWALRRLGDAKLIAHGHGHGGRLRLRMPRGQSGAIVLTLVSDPTHPHRAEVPIVVRGTRPRAVLVVLPAVAWQGLNPVDDDGDGMPNTLAAGASVQLARPLAPALSPGLRDQEGALLRYLDANLLRYDLTTDAAVATDAGPPLAGHRGVVLAGDERWITPRLRTLLRDYVRGGGRVWSLGTDGLRRSVRLRDGVLSAPSAPQPADALGARPRQPLQRVTTPATMTIYQDAPSLGLFTSTSGAFAGYDAYESLVPFTAAAKLLSAAGPEAGTPVIAAWQFGDGVAIHTGLPQLAAKALAGDADADALVQRIWALLAQPR